MARKKSNKFLGVFQIFFSSIKTYFLYLDQCLKYLAFPVLGQLISITLIFTLTYYYVTYYEKIQSCNTFFANDTNLFWTFIAIISPLLIVFLKAFFNYIIAFESLNILFYTVSGKKKEKQIDFKANDNIVKRRLFPYVILLLIMSFLLLPPIIIASAIFLPLVFQVFILENNTSPLKAISRSIELVKDNIIPTLILLALCAFTTYGFLPELFIWTIDKTSLNNFIIPLFQEFIKLLPLDNINNILNIVNMNIDSHTIAKTMFEGTVSAIVIAFTLPFRCCCFTELYKLYDSDKIKENSKQTDEIIKRATAKKGKN